MVDPHLRALALETESSQILQEVDGNLDQLESQVEEDVVDQKPVPTIENSFKVKSVEPLENDSHGDFDNAINQPYPPVKQKRLKSVRPQEVLQVQNSCDSHEDQSSDELEDEDIDSEISLTQKLLNVINAQLVTLL